MTDIVQVPREATEEMIEAGYAACYCSPTHVGRRALTKAYAAMLAAAPQATDPRDAEIERLRKVLEQAQRRFAQISGREVYQPHVHARTGVAEIDIALTTQPSKTETRDDG